MASKDDLGTERDSARLIRRARDGDDQAFTALFRKHEPALRARIRQRLAPRVRRRIATSDVLQQTLITAAGHIAEFEYRGGGSFGRWLAGIADNHTHKAVRGHLAKKRDARAEVSGGHQAGAAMAGMATASHVAMGGELEQRVLTVLHEMPEDYQTVIQLLQHRRMTIAEASELMGRSANAVKKLHGRALADLADRLGLEGGQR